MFNILFMDYKYNLEDEAEIDITIDCPTIINILCYHIEKGCKYPFLQFLLEKIQFTNNLFPEKLHLPIIFLNEPENIGEIVLSNINSILKKNGWLGTINDEAYKGIIYGEDGINYALINISDLDINGQYFSRDMSHWFALPSEIINSGHICNISFDHELTNLFLNFPDIGFLSNKISGKKYILPDAVYTGDEFRKVEFKSVFGNLKSKIYDTCSEYYYFHRSFGNAIKDGGWLKDGCEGKIGDRITTKPKSNKYINGGINRYALFVEGNMFTGSLTNCELTDELTDQEINTKYPEPCVVICTKTIKPNILVKNFESFVSLSYYKIQQSVLFETYSEDNNDKYMVI